jgi:hypothetical protein
MPDPAVEPTGWPDSAGQFDIHPVTPADVDRWEEWARLEAWRIQLGRFNWPAAMRCLCAEVRRLRGKDGADV